MAEPVLYGRAAIMKNPLIEIVDGEGKWKGRKFVGNVFGQILTAMYQAANLNLTFDDSQVIFGKPDAHGKYDGVIGLLERNESDFSVFGIPMESFHKNIDLPVKVIGLNSETKYFVVTNPSYNRTIIRSDIEDSINNIDGRVIVFYVAMFVTINWLIKRSSRRLYQELKLDRNQWRESNRNRNRNRVRIRIRRHSHRMKNVAWNMIRLVFRQGSSLKLKSWLQLWLFWIFECSIGILIVLYMIHINADLVTYNKPHLLDNLQDVWNAGDDVKITFTESSSVSDLFKSAPSGSLWRKLYDRSLSQWRSLMNESDNEGKSSYLHLLPSDRMLSVPTLVKKHKMALLAPALPVQIIIGLECKNMEALLRGEETIPLKYSTLHVSRECFMSENQVMVVSRSISTSLANRLAKYNERLMHSGFHERTSTKGAELTIQSIPIGTAPSVGCFNSKEWDDAKLDQSTAPYFGLESLKRFLIHCSISLLPSLLLLLMERTYFNILSLLENDAKQDADEKKCAKRDASKKGAKRDASNEERRTEMKDSHHQKVGEVKEGLSSNKKRRKKEFMQIRERQMSVIEEDREEMRESSGVIV